MNIGFRKSSLWIGKANGENIFTKTQKNIAEKLCNDSSPRVLCELYIFDLRMFLYGTNYTAKWLQPTVSLRLHFTINSLLEIFQNIQNNCFSRWEERGAFLMLLYTHTMVLFLLFGEKFHSRTSAFLNISGEYIFYIYFFLHGHIRGESPLWRTHLIT